MFVIIEYYLYIIYIKKNILPSEENNIFYENCVCQYIRVQNVDVVQMIFV